MKQQNRKTPLIFRIGLMLACVLILCCHMMGGLYARYATTCTSSGEARVARFSFQDDIDEKYQSIPTSFGPGESVSTTIQIENTAEVTLKYVVKVENLTKNLPIKVLALALPL